MKTFTVVWHYIGNHGMVRTEAESGEKALENIMQVYSGEEFKEKANCFVFEGDPVHTMISSVYPERIWKW